MSLQSFMAGVQPVDPAEVESQIQAALTSYPQPRLFALRFATFPAAAIGCAWGLVCAFDSDWEFRLGIVEHLLRARQRLPEHLPEVYRQFNNAGWDRGLSDIKRGRILNIAQEAGLPHEHLEVGEAPVTLESMLQEPDAVARIALFVKATPEVQAAYLLSFGVGDGDELPRGTRLFLCVQAGDAAEGLLSALIDLNEEFAMKWMVAEETKWKEEIEDHRQLAAMVERSAAIEADRALRTDSEAESAEETEEEDDGHDWDASENGSDDDDPQELSSPPQAETDRQPPAASPAPSRAPSPASSRAASPAPPSPSPPSALRRNNAPPPSTPVPTSNPSPPAPTHENSAPPGPQDSRVPTPAPATAPPDPPTPERHAGTGATHSASPTPQTPTARPRPRNRHPSTSPLSSAPSLSLGDGPSPQPKAIARPQESAETARPKAGPGPSSGLGGSTARPKTKQSKAAQPEPDQDTSLTWKIPKYGDLPEFDLKDYLKNIHPGSETYHTHFIQNSQERSQTLKWVEANAPPSNAPSRNVTVDDFWDAVEPSLPEQYHRNSDDEWSKNLQRQFSKWEQRRGTEGGSESRTVISNILSPAAALERFQGKSVLSWQRGRD